ncbi:MAG TPA: coproporphyrinogen III oxidase family protein, partial [Ignavibacteriaceae bacterium]|nr:coproporphyrinogen III oxidase family protein [Ignavibacteriaceae bacterium]
SQKNHALMNFEILSNDQQHEEYVMLALRSSGLNLQEYNKRFSDEWLTRNYQYLENLQKENYLKLDHSNIKLTSKGYAVCDEILKNIL